MSGQFKKNSRRVIYSSSSESDEDTGDVKGLAVSSVQMVYSDTVRVEVNSEENESCPGESKTDLLPILEDSSDSIDIKYEDVTYSHEAEESIELNSTVGEVDFESHIKKEEEVIASHSAQATLSETIHQEVSSTIQCRNYEAADSSLQSNSRKRTTNEQQSQESLASNSSYTKRRRLSCLEDGEYGTQQTSLDFGSMDLEGFKIHINYRRYRFVPSTHWIVNSNIPKTPEINQKIPQFFKTCGPILKHLEWICYTKSNQKQEQDPYLSRFVSLLDHSTSLEKITLHYETNATSNDDVSLFVEQIGNQYRKGKLPKLKSLRLTSVWGYLCVTKSGINAICEAGVPWEELELGEFLWQDTVPDSLEKLLETFKKSMKSLVIHGGVVSHVKRDGFHEVKVPRMEQLERLSICEKYIYESREELKCKKTRFNSSVVSYNCSHERLEDAVMGVPSGISLSFTGELPQLSSLSLGSLVEIEGLPFSVLKKLNTFKCGSHWNYTVDFPSDSSLLKLDESTVTALQIPDGIQDVSFLSKISKLFPNLSKVWIKLPSLPVLHEFFKQFANSKIEELYLLTQFDFPSTLECCLFPREEEMNVIPQGVRKGIEILKDYKCCDEFCRYFNVQLPQRMSEFSNHKGLPGLNNLRKLHLEHLLRDPLRIPERGEIKRWTSSDCKYSKGHCLGWTGDKKYKLSVNCYRNILRLPLESFTWKNFINPIQSDREIHNRIIQDLTVSNEEHDLFSPVGAKKRLLVQIKTSELVNSL